MTILKVVAFGVRVRFPPGARKKHIYIMKKQFDNRL